MQIHCARLLISSGTMTRMQSVRYGDFKCSDEACWYFLQLHRSFRNLGSKDQIEDQLYLLSDAVRSWKHISRDRNSMQLSFSSVVQAAKSALFEESGDSESDSSSFLSPVGKIKKMMLHSSF